MDLSWPLSPWCSMNGGTRKDTFHGQHHKMHLLSAQDLANITKKVGKGVYPYCRDIARAYCQLPLDPCDWPLVCFDHDGSYYANVRLTLLVLGSGILSGYFKPC